MKKILTNRELEVLVLAADGFTNPEIAKELTISIHTVKSTYLFYYSKDECKWSCSSGSSCS